MKKVKLSKRLHTVAALLPPCAVAADVGADRGELSYHLLRTDQVGRMIVSDVSPRCLERAKSLFDGDPLAERVEFRLGNGLTVLQAGEAAHAVIAGIGGRTVCEILTVGASELRALQSIVIQAMTDVPLVRQCLQTLGLALCDEALLYEDGHFYTVLRAAPGTMDLSARELAAGPLLLRQRPPLLAEFIAAEIAERAAVLAKLSATGSTASRYQTLQKELQFWEELANDQREGDRGSLE